MKPRPLALVALMIGPATCAVDQVASYALVQRVAAKGANSIALLTTATAGVILVGFLLSWSVYRRTQPEHGGKEERNPNRFLAALGMALNLFFFVLVVAGFGLPQLILPPAE